jgi:CHAT domain-containing protein/tetratricopeptide (TPR) repeat protein
MNGTLMPNPIAKCACLLGSLALGVTMLVGQPQPSSQTQSQAQAPPQAQAQPTSPHQQEIEALADKLIAAPNEEARSALLTANRDLVTADLAKFLVEARGLPLLRAKTDLPKTRAIFEITVSIAERLNDKNRIANSLNDIGLVLKDQGDYEAALDYAHRAAAIFEQMRDPDVALAYNNIGIVLRLQGNYQEASDYYRKALRIYEAQSDRRSIALASFNLGHAYANLGNQRLALEQYRKSLEISKELGIQLGLAYNSDALGTVYESQGDYDLALFYYQQSLGLKEKAANQREVANTLMNIGVVYQEMMKPALAREYLDKALKVKETSGDKGGVAEIQYNYGLMLRQEGDYAGALEHDRTSIALGEDLGNKSVLADALTEMARSYYAQKEYSHALEAGRRATEIARQIGAIGILWRSTDVTALALAKSGQTEEARAMLAEAIAAVEELRNQAAGGEEERASFLAGKTEPYKHLVQLLISQNKLEEALAAAERAKARVLLDVMRSGRIRIDKAMTGQENEQEHKLVSRLASLNVQLSAEKAKSAANSARLAQLNADLYQARLEYRGFQTALYAAHPELQVERGDSQPVSLAQTTALLPDPRTALLEFVVTEETAYLFVSTKGPNAGSPQLAAYTLAVTAKQLAARVDGFRKQLATRDPDYGRSAHELYRLLLRPAHATLAGKTRIVIVPDGPLWELPFQALQPTAGHHLLEDAAISYAPSLTVLLEMVKRHGVIKSEAERLLAMGNPAFSKQDADRLIAQANLAPNDHALRDLPVDLPNAQHEVAALSRLYGARQSTIYTGAAATEQAFKADAAKYDVLHLATHGIFDNRNPMYSHLLLAGPGTSGDDDGLLEAWEVVNLTLKADLVVLSACETARGKASGGEGLIGMSWAFFVAGSPALVASQWKVDSASTTELMVNFHRGLRNPAGLPGRSAAKARALQQAALRVMKSPQYRHPFYWAGFVLIGDGS